MKLRLERVEQTERKRNQTPGLSITQPGLIPHIFFFSLLSPVQYLSLGDVFLLSRSLNKSEAADMGKSKSTAVGLTGSRAQTLKTKKRSAHNVRVGVRTLKQAPIADDRSARTGNQLTRQNPIDQWEKNGFVGLCGATKG